MAVIAPDGSMWTRSRCAMRRGTAAARRTHPMGPASPVNCAQAKAPTCSASGAQEKMELCKMATRAAPSSRWNCPRSLRRRSDLGQFQRDDGAARVAILHNSIFSCAPLAEQVGALAWAQLTGLAGPIGWVRLAAAVPRRIAHRDRVHIDPSGAITAIDSANPYVPTNLHRTTVAYLGSEVWRHGVCVGRVMTELVADVADGMVMPFGDAAHDAFLMRTDHVAS